MIYRQPDRGALEERAEQQQKLDAEVVRFVASSRTRPLMLTGTFGCVVLPALTLPAMFVGCGVGAHVGQESDSLGTLAYLVLGGAIGICVGVAVFAWLFKRRRLA